MAKLERQEVLKEKHIHQPMYEKKHHKRTTEAV